ncbi:Sodium channel protein 60E (Drosophila ion channel 60) (Drosophila sodium channel 1) (Protein smell-impaired 60E) (Sodium channel 2) (DmNav2) [Durusdinium trenchii]|uniref:Sodium channel protein 60E (Drosophila ion channel 60) (Drosophila sodium channel 1) (Protein smell-impaired 60E) (Sodium channel 2) (DmNav2) n=1 Tax=Durusdinium trenchii TaxID=1381693 RepID=A0ABP0MG66_9DINO
MTVLKDPPLPLPVSVRSKLSFRDTAPSFSCSYCGTESGLMPMEPSILKPQEQTLEGRESYHVLTALTETVRHSQKALNFHCNRLVLLTGDDDLAGHVFRTSQGEDVVSELCNGIEEALLDVEVYKRQLESMSDEIVQGRRRWTISRQEVIESGVDFIGSEGTLSNPKGAQAAVANGFEIDPDAPHEFEVKVEDPPDARKTDSADAAQVQPSISDTRRGYSRIRSLLRAGSHVSNLGREVNPGPFSWWVFFRELVKSPKFDLTFAVLIFLSSLVMALQVQYHGFDVGYELGYFGMFYPAEEVWPNAAPVFNGLELTIGVVFLFEILVRILAARCRFWCDPWNVLDLFVVVAWAVDTVTVASLPVDPMLLRLLRLIKLFRLLRLIRKVKGFDSLYIMVTSIKASFSALLWSTVLLFAVLTTIALILTTLVDVYLNSDSNPLERRLRVFEYYGTFTRCALTLLELTLANWVPASRVLTEDVSEFYTIFVLMFQASMGFSVVKVIMGVFLQNTFSVAANDDVIMMNSKDRALQTHKMKMSILFEAADTNGDGRLDREEFAEILADPLVSRWLSAMGFDIVTSSNEIFDLLRETEDLSAEEMIAGVARLSGPASSLNMAQLLYEGDVLRKEVEGISMAVHQELTEIGMEVPPPPLRSESTSLPKLRSLTTINTSRTRRTSMSQKIFSQKRLESFHEAKRFWTRISQQALVLTESFHFQLCFAMLICSLCAVMGFEVQYRGYETGYKLGYTGYTKPAHEVWPAADTAFEVVDIFFGVVFTLELILKFIAGSLSFFKDMWNWLDGLVLIVWYLERITSTAFPLDPMMLRLFRLSRLMRMVRLVKIFEQCDALYLMLTSIRASFAALAWSSALLLLIQMMLALAIVTLVEPYFSDPNATGDKYAVYSYYGTFTRAMLTLFEITLGNFVPVTRLMMQDVSELYVMFALVHKLVIGFAVVMVITGVFVQETFSVAQTDNTIMINQKERALELHIAKMTALFKAADYDSSGRLDRGEWLQVCDDYSVQLWLAAMGLDVSNAALVHELICAASNQQDLNAKDLVSGIARLKGSARNIDMALFRKA